MKSLDFNNPDEVANPERYLLGLSLAPSPNPEILTGTFLKRCDDALLFLAIGRISLHFLNISFQLNLYP